MNYQREAANIATMTLCWIFVYLHSLIFNIYSGTVLVDSAKETALILHRIMCCTSDTEVLEKLYQISEMLYTRQPVLGFGLLVWNWQYFSSVRKFNFSVFHCFELDTLHPLNELQLVGAVCMYLIILIQFYVSSKN